MPNQGLLTVGDIVQQGCQQGGNPGLLEVPVGETVSYAIKAFRTLLHHIYLTRDLPKLETEGSISTSAAPSQYQISLSTLTRYRSINAIFLKDSNSSVLPELEPVDHKTIWRLLQNDLAPSTALTGIPNKFAINPAGDKILIHPIPVGALTGSILYYRIPDVSAYVSATTAATLDFEDSNTLVKMMEDFVRNWDKDNLVGLAAAVADRSFAQYRASAEDQGRVKGPITAKLSGTWYKYGRGD